MRNIKIIFISIFLFCMIIPVCAQDLIAYPVPFNPVKASLQLRYSKARAPVSVHIIICDCNGDTVLERDYSSISTFRWKGFNGSGEKVSSGLYIIRVLWEDPASGNMKTDSVRVTLVRR